MSYKDVVEEINKKYDGTIDDIKQTKNKYQESIDILNKINGIDDCNDLKVSILDKQRELDDKIEDIKKIKENLIEKAENEDKNK